MSPYDVTHTNEGSPTMTRHRTTTASRGTAPPKPDPVEAAATALAAVGPVTAAQLASHLGVAYPSITPRLRRLETDGRAERIKEPDHRPHPLAHHAADNPAGPRYTHGDGSPGEPSITPRAKPPPTPGDAAPDIGDTADAQSTPDTTGAPHRPTSRVRRPRRGTPTCRRRLTDSRRRPSTSRPGAAPAASPPTSSP